MKFGIIKERAPWQEMKSKLAKIYVGRNITATLIDQDLPCNKITTSKYTYLSFIPMNLLFQFSKMANAYFLVIGVM